MWWINAPDITSAYREIVQSIMRHGESVNNTLEIMNLAVYIEKPKPQIPPQYPVKQRMMDEYIKQFFDERRPEGFAYTYGSRIFHPNQVKAAIKKLEEDPYSRQAILHTWRVNEDMDACSVPCLQTIHYLNRDGKLHTTAYFRSNDMGMAWVSNVNAILSLSKKVAYELNLNLGSLTTLSSSAHILKSEIEFITENFK